MSIVSKKQILCDGELVEMTIKYGHWLPKLLNKGATTIGRTTYVLYTWDQTALIILAHECSHIYDFVKFAKKIKLGYFLSTPLFLLRYLYHWVKSGFDYHKISDEVTAYGKAEAILTGVDKEVYADWIVDRFNKGYKIPTI